MNRVANTFRSQAEGCGRLGSPFMKRLLGLVADRLEPGSAVADCIINWPGELSSAGDALPLRLAGGLHALKRAGHPGLTRVYPPNAPDDDTLWKALSDAMQSDEQHLLQWLDQPPQTNEVRRAAVLIPAMHLLAGHFGLPLRLTEIGASAGLNLQAAEFQLDAGGTRYGPPDSTLNLAPEWTGPAPPPADVRITNRTGLDIAPVDPAKDAERLIAYLWPDQPDRIARTEAAIALALSHPPEMLRINAIDWLKNPGPPRERGKIHLIFHTIAWQYLDEAERAAGDALIARAGTRATPDAPLARFAMEADGDAASLRLQVWPGDVTFDLGRADYHGRWVEWRCATLSEDT